MSRLRALHDAAGARWSDDAVPVPRNYGDPAAEYHEACTGAVAAERSDRSIVRVHGRDPVKMIQGLISNDIVKAPPDRAVYATVLTPKGKMVADVRVLRHGPDLLLETDAGAAEGLMQHLRKFVPPLFAKFEDANAAWGELGVYGPHARVVLTAALGMALPEKTVEDDLHTGELDGAPVLAIATAYFGVPGFDLLVSASALGNVWQALASAGARPVGHATLDVLRIEAGSPRWGAELTDATIPLEAGLRERAISETKGCYTGQEVIIRILHRGHVNRHLRGLLLGDAPAPTPGTELLRPDDQKKVGQITSAVWSPKLGQAVALAYVRREVEPGTRVLLGSPAGPSATVVMLPWPGTSGSQDIADDLSTRGSALQME